MEKFTIFVRYIQIHIYMDKLKSLLNQINVILAQERAIKQERQIRGENFNIFSTLNLSKNETRLHSAFIAELLNPKGAHGLQDSFLKCFIQNICPSFDFNTINTHVETEYYIGQISKDGVRGGRIDIILLDVQNHAVIIENKIGASEQGTQLERYNNYAKDKKFSDYRLLYLTPEGNESNTIKDKSHYLSISYRNDILNWLESCVCIAACHPLIRETIRQYITNLKEILYIMDRENENKLIEIATTKDYVDSTLTIIENTESIKRNIRVHFVDQLKKLADNKGLEFDCDENLCDLQDCKWISLSKPSVSQLWKIYIGWHKQTQSEGAYYGIARVVENNTPSLPDSIKEQLPHIWTDGKQDEEFPCGWSYLWGKDGKTGKWYDWRELSTLKDMVNGKMLAFIEHEIIDKVLNEHLLEKVQEVIPE